MYKKISPTNTNLLYSCFDDHKSIGLLLLLVHLYQHVQWSGLTTINLHSWIEQLNETDLKLYIMKNCNYEHVLWLYIDATKLMKKALKRLTFQW